MLVLIDAQILFCWLDLYMIISMLLIQSLQELRVWLIHFVLYSFIAVLLCTYTCLPYRPRARGPPLPPLGDFCRHIFLKTMDLELPKSDCLQEIRWCVWLWRAFKDRYPLENSKIQFWPRKKSFLDSTYIKIMPVWTELLPYDLGWHFSTKYS